MSDAEKKEDCVMESQETEEADTSKEDAVASTQMSQLNESQDFRLVDSDDDSLEKSNDSKERPNESVKESANESDLNMGTEIEKVTDPAEVSTTDKASPTCETQTEASERERVDGGASSEEAKEKHSDDDDDIVQCTPPDARSPPKKLSANAEVTKLKRKAESFEEPPRKVLRMTSTEDALSSDKGKLEIDESCPFLSNDEEKNVIIAETQDDDVATQVTTRETKSDEATMEEKSVESHTVRIEHNDDGNFIEKSYEIDKNENINESPKLNDTFVNKESTKKPSLVESIAQPSETVTESTEDKQKEEEQEEPRTTADDSKKPESNHEGKNDCTNSVAGNAIVNNEHSVERENCIEADVANDTERKSLTNDTQGISSSALIDDCPPTNKNFTNPCISRMSIEVIYDKKSTLAEAKPRPRELVEIDEEGEKIVLDSSQEDSVTKLTDKDALDKSETVYKSCYDTTKSSSEFSYKSIGSTKETSVDGRTDNRLVNGSSESKKCDTDSTASVQSDMFSDIPPMLDKTESGPTVGGKSTKGLPSISKDSDHADLLSVSDNEPDVSIVDDSIKSKSDLGHSVSLTKSHQVEREVGIYVKMKCLLHIDETTKEFVGKEVTSVHCEPLPDMPLSRQKTNDTSASLADISGNDNKDSSPGSVNSNPQLYQLNPSRLSFASTVSSLSSVSSAASLAAKIVIRDSAHFSLPRGPAKHAKKVLHDLQSGSDKQQIDEMYERLTKEWQNSRLLTATVLNFANAELSGGSDTCNVSNERIDDQLQKIRSSTPEVPKELIHSVTPKSTKKGKAVKRQRSKSARSEGHSNGLNKISPKVLIPTESGTPTRKKNKTEPPDSAGSSSNAVTAKSSEKNAIADELLGKEVFAKWSDNNYYPGTVIDKVKSKYKVTFYDGKNKVLIEDFVIPIPKTLNEGLSVYATTKTDDYGSCGIIVDVETANDEVYYTVETDEGERLQVQVKDIFLSSDQAHVLREELCTDTKSFPTTPKHLGQVSLDNMVDGKRRSRRIATPGFTTPKSRLTHTPKPSSAEPSVSGMAAKLKREKKVSDNEALSSDSNVSVKEDPTLLTGIQPEIIGTPNEQIVKGPASRMKGKSRSKKKQEDEETIATLGPIPPLNSTLFKGMSFILTCVSMESIDRYQSGSKDSGSDAGTENEEEWSKKPFVRERLKTQIIEGGGKVYDEFDQIPQEEYKSTKLITNVPNTTAKSLLCLSVGIPAYNHNWIIRCCQEGKIVNPAEDELPAGWSLEKKSYVEMFQRPSNKPLAQVVVIIPLVEQEKQFSTFWRQICENAGAVVLLADGPDSMEGFVEGTLVLTNHRCPSWAVQKANELQIPLLSSTWIVQSLIEGKECPKHMQERYKYNYVQN